MQLRILARPPGGAISQFYGELWFMVVVVGMLGWGRGERKVGVGWGGELLLQP